jgi:hypothetical protein
LGSFVEPPCRATGFDANAWDRAPEILDTVVRRCKKIIVVVIVQQPLRAALKLGGQAVKVIWDDGNDRVAPGFLDLARRVETCIEWRRLSTIHSKDIDGTIVVDAGPTNTFGYDLDFVGLIPIVDKQTRGAIPTRLAKPSTLRPRAHTLGYPYPLLHLDDLTP